MQKLSSHIILFGSYLSPDLYSLRDIFFALLRLLFLYINKKATRRQQEGNKKVTRRQQEGNKKATRRQQEGKKKAITRQQKGNKKATREGNKKATRGQQKAT